MGALGYAAATLGWNLRMLHPLPHAELAALLGLDRAADFAGVEQEEARVLLEVQAPGVSAPAAVPPLSPVQWFGRANVIDPHPMYSWPAIDEVAESTRQTSDHASNERYQSPQCRSFSAEVILRRRSAQRFDRAFTMSRYTFDLILTNASAAWDGWNFAPRLHLILFVHRVEGLAPGLYIQVRRPDAEALLRRALNRFAWQPVEAGYPLFLLQAADMRSAARTIHCHQAIAADSCFALGMLAEFEDIVQADPWRYRQLHWEAGLLGQALYLEAEAVELNGIGVGCYFDEAVHELLGLEGSGFLWQRYIRPRFAKIGLAWADFRAMRRTNSTLMRAAGADAKVSAGNRGHGLGVAMEEYTHSTPDQKREAVRKLEAIVN